MSAFPLLRPLLPSHYRVLLEPPDEKGDETLAFVSEARRVKLKGHSFREFQRAVIPLLDGRHTLEAINAATEQEFALADLEDALGLLLAQGLLREGDATPDAPAGLAGDRLPQSNLWHDLGLDPATVHGTLAASTVAVFGLAGAGAVAAQALAAAGIGTLRLVEREPISRSDPYLAALYSPADSARPRGDVVRERLGHAFPNLRIELSSEPLDDDAAVRQAIGDASFVLCCLDGGRSSSIYKLNRVCLQDGRPWLAATTAATDVVVGPLMRPPDTPCYLCYRMRLVAAAQNPEDEYALQSLLDRRKRDDSPAHESLVFGEGIAGQLAAFEVVKALARLPAPAFDGHLLVFNLLTLTATRHRVLRKPWCPACGGVAADTGAETGTLSR